MTFKTPLLIAALLAGVAVQGAQAQGFGPADRPDFAELDTDGDGALSEDELRAPLMDRFAEADADGDGSLTAEEMVAAAEAARAERLAERMERLVARLDANGDGVLQAEEFTTPAPRPTAFERLDRDGDGAVSEDEFSSLSERFAGREHGPRHGGPRFGRH
ncbi:EF-hand domain-containing protein [Histidinibacterium aquaticum]|nr:EF-hand domain-containing protein [Histidinibacterium aquaticum]